MANSPDESGAPRFPKPPLEAVAKDEERRERAKKNLVRALQSYLNKLEKATSRDAHRETELFCDYARENYASRAEPYFEVLPQLDPEVLFRNPRDSKRDDLSDLGDLSGLLTIGDVCDLAESIELERPQHWPVPPIYRGDESAEERDVFRRLIIGSRESFKWLLEEPEGNWFRQQLRDCVDECVRDMRALYERRFPRVSMESPIPSMPSSSLRILISQAKTEASRAVDRARGQLEFRQQALDALKDSSPEESLKHQGQADCRLANAQRHMEFAPTILFDAFAEQCWSVTRPNAKAFSEQLPSIRAEISKAIDCSELESVVAEKINSAATKWLKKTVREGAMQNSNQWSEFRAGFADLLRQESERMGNVADHHLLHAHITYGPEIEDTAQWSFVGSTEAIQSDYALLATRAALALGAPKGVDLVGYWLRTLCEALAEGSSEYLQYASKGDGGMIRSLLRATVMCCGKFERIALENDHSAPRSQTRSDSISSEAIEKPVAQPPAETTLPNGPLQAREISGKAFITDWGQIEIRFVSDERIQIISCDGTDTKNYTEFGCEDRRSKKPNFAWAALRALSADGTLNPNNVGRPRVALEKRMQEIRNLLRARFEIARNPLPFIEGKGYVAQFKISRARSFDT